MDLLFPFENAKPAGFNWSKLAKLIQINHSGLPYRLISWGDGWVSNGHWLINAPASGILSMPFMKERGKLDKDPPSKKFRNDILKTTAGHRRVEIRRLESRSILLEKQIGIPQSCVLDYEDGLTAAVVDHGYLRGILDVLDDERIEMMAQSHSDAILFIKGKSVLAALMPVHIESPRNYDWKQ